MDTFIYFPSKHFYFSNNIRNFEMDFNVKSL